MNLRWKVPLNRACSQIDDGPYASKGMWIGNCGYFAEEITTQEKIILLFMMRVVYNMEPLDFAILA